jgi:predicted AlkP superfamily phosphohydrolase/phosphomutase/tetratricopeptide (TPR) repeat protein
MRIETLERHRIPVGLVLLAASIWLAIGIQRTTDDAGAAILDSPLRLIRARRISSGWHLAPPGLFRISVYPVSSATLVLNAGAGHARLVSREGTEVLARATLRYKIDPDRLLEVHASLGPDLERDALGPWVLEALRDSIQGASYSAISGERTEELREALGRKLGERFRSAGLVLLSCDVSGVRIRSAGAPVTTAGGAPVRGMKVTVIGLDGADWNIIDPLMEAGKLPNLSRLARGGVRSRLRSITPMLSPVIWTSIATGVLPARHGIIDFLATTGREGERVPVTSGLRKVKAIWNILSERGVSVGITAWWATYPAEEVKGYIVSDRVAYQLFGAPAPGPQAREGKVYPADLDSLVSSLTIAPETINLSDLSRYIRITSDPTALPDSQSKLIEDFKTLLAAGDTYAQVSTTLTQRFHPDFTGFYLEGTDTVSHLFMPYTPPLLQGVDKDGARRFGRTVEEYYRHADDIVGKVVAAAEPGSAIIVCSDHGFRTGENRPLTDSRIGYGQAADWHRKYGILILSGDPFRKHETLEEASVLDITPTILALFGLPVAEDMDGRPILDGFDARFLLEHPVAYVPSYEGTAIPSRVEDANVKRDQPEGGRADHPQTPADPEGDQNLKEKLRSLGYITENTANSHNNRGMVLLTQGRYDDAISEFRKAAESSEDLSIAKINIARAYFKKKDYAAALTALQEHLKRHPRSKEAENLLGNIAMEQGRTEEAESHFKQALEYEPHFTDARNSLGILYDRLGRHDDALREFLKVVEVDKDYAESYNNIGVIYKNRGKIEDAVSWFKKAVQADAEFAGSYSNLALIDEDKGDLKGAEEQFRHAIKRDPHNAAPLPRESLR